MYHREGMEIERRVCVDRSVLQQVIGGGGGWGRGPWRKESFVGFAQIGFLHREICDGN